MYERTEKILHTLGYERYELSNYARPGYECRHNCGYWTGKPYLGFGLAASSYFRGKRFTNPADMEKYLSITDFSGIFEKETELTKKEEMEEYMFLGLRMTKGISKNGIFQAVRDRYPGCLPGTIQELSGKGLLEQDAERIWIPQQALFLSNQVMMEFLL